MMADGSRPPGILYGLGVGPGDPELITVKALRILRAVPVIAYPATLAGESMARASVNGHLPGGQTEIPLAIDIQAGHAKNAPFYDRAARMIAGHLEAGRDVAVLCEGDPFFYGSFMYVFGRLAEKWRTEVVPGVSSLNACAAALHAPLAGGNDVLTVLPASLDEAVLKARLRETDGAAVIKIGRHFAKLARVLNRLGLSGKARYIERVGLSDERIVPIGEVAEGKAPYFSMVLVHHRGEAWR